MVDLVGKVTRICLFSGIGKGFSAFRSRAEGWYGTNPITPPGGEPARVQAARPTLRGPRASSLQAESIRLPTTASLCRSMHPAPRSTHPGPRSVVHYRPYQADDRQLTLVHAPRTGVSLQLLRGCLLIRQFGARNGAYDPCFSMNHPRSTERNAGLPAT